MDIYFWQDGVWCTQGNIEEYLTFYGDDFGVVYVPSDFDDDDIDIIIDATVKNEASVFNVNILR